MFVSTNAQAAPVTLFDGRAVAAIVHDADSPLRLAATMFANDLQQVSGVRPALSARLEDCLHVCVVVTRAGSPLYRAVMADAISAGKAPPDGWERYGRGMFESRSHSGRRYVLIAGSDTRGAIWGVVDLSREIGVSAWEWWADVKPRRTNSVVIDGDWRVSATPSVQYRGIFLNDEDWGLQPWAARTFEPKVGDIGPKTYSRIFELLWRLKANLIWPAMHDSTRPFYSIAGNADAARDHAIVVGTSHAEPMMRNNFTEWDEAKRGPFNFFTNADAMERYWGERLNAVKSYENIYTVGLRGKHDSEMEGNPTPDQARDAVAKVIDIQRDLLSKATGRPADRVPQVLTLYKEVLDIYSRGLKVPDDVTLVWPEDNYGYINQLSTPAERGRSGGAGVYYHISYWGRPHDYLWLATTHPALIREQMERAWATDARKLWVVNVGDIKPGEYLTQYFLDLAFDHQQFALPAREHLKRWVAVQFGSAEAGAIADVLFDYYDLAFERRPEFMGFSQVEPITPIRISDYAHGDGREATDRIERYTALTRRAEALAEAMPVDRRAAFFELVLYPVRAAANLNIRNLKLDMAALYTRQGRPAANHLVDDASAAHEQIVTDTAQYNTQLDGKWSGILNMAPRDLPVFAKPPFPHATFAPRAGCVVDTSALTFVAGRPATHDLTVYSWGAPVAWTATAPKGLAAAMTHGSLDAANGYQAAVPLHYAGTAAIGEGSVTCGGKTFPVSPRFVLAQDDRQPVEIDHVISITASNPAAKSEDWEQIDGLGSRSTVMRSRLALPSRGGSLGSPLGYTFTVAQVGDAQLHIVALPVHPLTSANRLRLGVQIDDAPLRILDFQTYGRSDEWKTSVLANKIERLIPLSQLPAGKHLLRIFALDPGFLLDRLDIRFDGASDRYGAPLLH